MKSLYDISQQILCDHLIAKRKLINEIYICSDTFKYEHLTNVATFSIYFDQFYKDNQKIFKDIYPFDDNNKKNILVNGNFDFENNYVINDFKNINIVSNLLAFIPKNIEAEIWSVLAAIMKKHVRNLQVATDAHYLHYLLRKLSITTGVIADQEMLRLIISICINTVSNLLPYYICEGHDFLIEIIAALLNYSVEVDELKLFFRFFQLDQFGYWRPHARKLLDVFCASIRRTCPESFFAFSGQPNSLISIPPLTKWPIQNGFTFNAWIQMENNNHITKYDKDKQYLYNILSSTKNCGFSAYFLASTFLILTCMMRNNGKGFQHCIKYDFTCNLYGNCCACYVIGKCLIVHNISKQPNMTHPLSASTSLLLTSPFSVPLNFGISSSSTNSTTAATYPKDFVHCLPFEFDIKKWYMITIVYVKNRWSRSEIQCYVNGELISRLETNWISSVAEIFDNCSIGNSFCGQMSAMYLFQDALTKQQINAIYKLGPSYEGQFHYENESENLRKLTESDKKTLYDGKLYSSIVFLYDPLACDGQLCLESSPKNNASYFLHSPHALMIGDVRAINTHTLVDTMHSLGGLAILYPIFQQINAPHLAFSEKRSNTIAVSSSEHIEGVIDYTLCGKLIKLIEELALTSHDVCSQLVQTRGIPLISLILTNNSRRHLNGDIVESFTNLVERCEQYVMAKQIMDFIFFNPRLWISAVPKVQAALYVYLATEFIAKTDWYKGSVVRADIVLQILNALKLYYYTVPPPYYWASPQPLKIKPENDTASAETGVKQASFEETPPKISETGKLFVKIYLETLPKETVFYNNTCQEIKNTNNLPLNGNQNPIKSSAVSTDPKSCINQNVATTYILPAPNTDLLCDRRPTQIEILNLRAYIILFLKQILVRDGGIKEIEMTHFIGYVSTVNEYENIQDVLQLLITLATEHPASFVPAFDKTNGIRMIFKLLNFEQEMIRVQALKLLGIFLAHSTQKRKEDSMSNYCLFSLIGERILTLPPNFYTPNIHNALMEILIEHTNTTSFMPYNNYQFGPIFSSNNSNISPPSNSYPTTDIVTDHHPRGNISSKASLKDDEISNQSAASVNRVSYENVQSSNTASADASLPIPTSIENPAILSVIANVMRQFCEMCPDRGDSILVLQRQTPNNSFEKNDEKETETYNTNLTLLDLKIFFLSDLGYLLSQRPENKRKVLQMSVWQDWLLGLIIFNPRTSKERYVTECVLDILACLIHHAIKYEYGGWRVWVDTMAITHSLVSKEAYKTQQNNFYYKNRLTTPTPTATSSTEIRKSQHEYQSNNDTSNNVTEATTDNKNVYNHNSNSVTSLVPFKIPEFRWSEIHLKLLSDILFRIERDTDVWKIEAGKNIIDIVNYTENQVFVQNVIHFLSQIMDNFVVGTGGVIQLLAYTTTSNFTQQHERLKLPPSLPEEERVLTPSRLMAYLVRMINLVDVFVFASSIAFQDMESEKNIPQGGILRQCLRLSCLCSVRNCLENQYRKLLHGISSSLYHQQHQNDDTENDYWQPAVPHSPNAYSSPFNVLSLTQSVLTLQKLDHLDTNIINLILGGNVDKNQTGYSINITPNILDTEVLLQNIDVTRLKAIIYRDIEETKQSQFLALCVTYFVSVLTVSKYRDLLDPFQSSNQLQMHSSSNNSPATARNFYENTQQHIPLNYREDDEMNYERKTRTAGQRDGLETEDDNYEDEGVDSIREGEIIEMRLEPVGLDNHSLSNGTAPDEIETAAVKPFNASDEEDYPKAAPYSIENEEVGYDLGVNGNENLPGNYLHSPQYSGTTIGMEETKNRNPDQTNHQNVSSINNAEDVNISSQSVGEGKTEFLTKRIERVLSSSVYLLKEVINDFLPFMVKTFVGSQGQELLKNPNSQTLLKDNSVLEFVMMLCSQEWQNSLQKHAGSAFLELINEGRILSHAMKDHVLRVSTEAEFILNKARAQEQKAHSDFEQLCAETQLSYHNELLESKILKTLGEKDVNSSLSFTAQNGVVTEFDRQKNREYFLALRFLEKIKESLYYESDDVFITLTTVSKESPNSVEEVLINEKRNDVFYKLDPWESDSRMRKKLIKNPFGTLHREETNDDGFEGALLRRINEDEVTVVGQSLPPPTGATGTTFTAEEIAESLEKLKTTQGQVASTHPNLNTSMPPSQENSSFDNDDNVSELTSNAGDYYEKRSPPPPDSKQLQPHHRFFLGTSSILSPTTTSSTTSSNLIIQSECIDNGYNPNDILLTTKCQLIFLGLTFPGTFTICKECFYFESDSTQDTDSLNIDLEVIKYLEINYGGCMKWNFTDITAIFSRRYLLRNNALEFFLATNTSLMFAFNTDYSIIIKKIIYLMPRVGVGNKYGIPQRRRVSLFSPKHLFKSSNMTDRWMRRDISNFDYLMFLNTIAGRTYQDLNQYPVFPWILSNYETSDIDLNNPTNYRDLTKPIGALNNERKRIFLERYKSWEHHTIPPFHYGTHYSTAAFVLNWLLRMEPFTTLFINLHGGKFDHPNRIFSSIRIAWSNCQRDTSDVKELIPELFYFPEMLCNVNSYKLATVVKENVQSSILPQSELPENLNHNEAQRVGGINEVKMRYDGPGDVELPPWAHEDPEKFIRIHRRALESEIVSCSLNRWIDLIFGYKQRGSAAVEATNVFYYLTYEDNFNIKDIPDPTLKEALMNQIKNFGQTPSQLLDTPHHPRQSLMHISPRMFTPIKPDQGFTKIKFPFNASVIYLSFATSPVSNNSLQYVMVVMNSNFNVTINKWNSDYKTHLMPPSFTETEFRMQNNLINIDPYYTLANPSSSINLNNIPLTQAMQKEVRDQLDPRSFAHFGSIKSSSSTLISSRDGKYLVIVGFRDKSFRVFSLEQNKTVQIIFGHRGIVTCIARSHSEHAECGQAYSNTGIFSDNATTFNANSGATVSPSPFEPKHMYNSCSSGGALSRTCGDNYVSNSFTNFHASQDFYLATGSRDTTIKLWRWCSTFPSTHHVIGNGLLPYKPTLNFNSVNNLKKISPYPIATLTGHVSEIVAIKLSSNLGIVASHSKNNLCLVHDTTGQIIHSLTPTPHSPAGGLSIKPFQSNIPTFTTVTTNSITENVQPKISQIGITLEGDILIYYDEIRICRFSINGSLLSERTFPPKHIKLFETFTHDFIQQVLAIVTTLNTIELYDVYEDFRHLYTYSQGTNPNDQNLEIKYLTFSPFSKYLVVGTSNGTVICYVIDPTKWEQRK